MNDLIFYFNEGWHHIVSMDALDHQLFIIAMAALFLLKDWRKVLWLVTAFTVGHSLTLALSVYDLIRFDSKWVEFLIPCTIVLTSLNNFRYVRMKQINVTNIYYNYVTALLFGLIHGMGFANSIRMMLASDQRIAGPLFSFNVGLEVGQIVLILILLFISQIIVVKLKFSRNYWIIILSSITLIISLKMAIERIP